MALTIPVQVQVPPHYPVDVNLLSREVSQYAQLLIDSYTQEEELETVSLAWVKEHTVTLDELRRDLYAVVHQHYHPAQCG